MKIFLSTADFAAELARRMGHRNAPPEGTHFASPEELYKAMCGDPPQRTYYPWNYGPGNIELNSVRARVDVLDYQVSYGSFAASVIVHETFIRIGFWSGAVSWHAHIFPEDLRAGVADAEIERLTNAIYLDLETEAEIGREKDRRDANLRWQMHCYYDEWCS